MSELSIFVDESGDQAGQSKYYAISFVFHDQSASIDEVLRRHKTGLQDHGLRDIPFHAGPLMTGHDDYEGIDPKTRKAYFGLFFLDVQHLPITYHTFLYRRSEYPDNEALVNRMRQDITGLLFDHLPFFQAFDDIKVYYDYGQQIVGVALRAAIEYVLARNSYVYRKTKASDFFLEQAADLICTLELTAVKFENKESTPTDERFFGGIRSFKKNYLKAIRRKRLK